MKFVYAAFAALLLLAMAARAQPTAFTYQGRLNNGTNPATGAYDFQFQIYNANNIVVGGPLTNAPTGVTNGLFTVTLDFGAPVFSGNALTLEIGVRTNGSVGAYTILSPRQPILSVPYAVQSLNASNAVTLTTPLQGTNITGTIPDTKLSANVALLNTNQVFTGANKFAGAVTATNPANIFAGTLSGNGIGQTNLSTTNLVGTLPDARLSTNVALLNTNAAFSGTVSAGLFAGNGHGLTNVPGAFFWVTVSGTNAQASSNVGYIVTNDVTPVTIMLPPLPSVGDVFKIAGVGGAGWILAQTNGQTILAGNLSDSIGASWTARATSNHWTAVASSADGTKLVATIKNGLIYTSTNSGVNWTTNASPQDWSSVASSADGTKLVATVGDTVSASDTGFIWTSANSGTTWLQQNNSTNQEWVSVASSADGTKLVGTVYGGSGAGIYTSVDSGAHWSLRLAGSFDSSSASSADGTKLAVTVYGSQILVSTNSGSSWTPHGNSLSWTAISSSADGSRLVATASANQVFISTDSGMTWNPANLATISASWTATASSSDGSRLAAVYTGPGSIYTSTDSGATWLQRTEAGNFSWTGIACSSDGSKIVAVADSNFIYTSSQGATTTGSAGYLNGARLTTLEIVYVGNGFFLPLSHEGTIRAY